LFLGYYVAYTAYLILNATQHASLPTFQAAMIWFAIPLTAITLAISVRQTIRRRRAAT
jgi:cation:H+ antiporter